ncbi:unnamed protein product [Adineta steineri]|uniref:Uncharacterized protein n=1 Tax=Adineta steineri TaxID=433720 RepID=A0A814Z7L3_9BILA|nr:unnamed protein product [Adineta steineri]
MEQNYANLSPNHVVSTIAQSRSIRFQKKLCKIPSNKYIAKCFIPTRLNRVLNNLHRLAEGFSNNNQIANRLIQKIVKSGNKFKVLYSNRIIFSSPNGEQLLMQLRGDFNGILTFIGILKTYDCMLSRFTLQCLFRNCRGLIHSIIGDHLTQKSLDRIDFIFNFISDADFLAYMFNFKLTLNRAIIVEIIDDLRVLVRDGLI